MIKKVFNIIFIILYCSVLLGIVSNKENLGFVIVALGLIVTLFLFLRKTGRRRKIKINNTLKICLFCLVHLIITCIFQYVMCFKQYADSLEIYNLSNVYLKIKDVSKMNMEYIFIYPHNQFFFILQTGIMTAITGLFNTEQEITYFILKCINSLIVSLSVFFMLMSVKNIWKGKYLKIAMVIVFLFIPLYIYGGILYTDTIAMCLTSIIIFLFSAPNFNRSKLKNVAIGIVMALGYIIKPSMIIIAIAFVIYMLLSKKWKPLIIGLLSCIITVIVINVCVNSLGVVSKENKDKYAYPFTHWVMMGLTTEGLKSHEIAGFYLPDSIATKSAGNYHEKINYNIEETQRRVKEQRNKWANRNLEGKTL